MNTEVIAVLNKLCFILPRAGRLVGADMLRSHDQSNTTGFTLVNPLLLDTFTMQLYVNYTSNVMFFTHIA